MRFLLILVITASYVLHRLWLTVSGKHFCALFNNEVQSRFLTMMQRRWQEMNIVTSGPLQSLMEH